MIQGTLMVRRTAVVLFGTRPEVIKLAPVVAALERRSALDVVNVASSQHRDLSRPFAAAFGVRIDHDLDVMRQGQTPTEVCARVLTAFDRVIEAERPDMVLVQGDTTTALAGALAGFHRGVPVGHVEAGLRTGDPASPFPEEMNRRLITRLASRHFAATARNVESLRAEGVPAKDIVLTGNPVVDALQSILADGEPSPALRELLERLRGQRVIALTTHRRENFGAVMTAHLAALRRFVEKHADVALVFPVHPNPAVRRATAAVLEGAERVWLLDPLDYADFIHLLSEAWLLVSDSGGVQEEAPTLGKPLLVLRENTERPEAIDCGVARLVGNDSQALEMLLERAHDDRSWFDQAARVDNPFGRGDAGERIAASVEAFLGVRS
jgi:UDP-N-acetylglucosamine 2-epimerase (non-hydrolysing)